MARTLAPLLLVALAGLPAAGQTPRDEARAVEQHLRKVIDGAEPSVVAVVVSQRRYPPPPVPGRRTPGRLGKYAAPPGPFGMPAPAADPRLDLSDPQAAADNLFGSGLVLDPVRDPDNDGPRAVVLTNYHLIDGATKIFVRAASGKGSYADVRAADARSDLAVLQLIDPVPGLRPVRFAAVRTADGPAGPATVFRGMGVIAVGHPLAAGVADGSPSASWGLLSNVRRRAAGPPREDGAERLRRGLPHFSTLLQTDARITLGCSGGGLFNLDGEAVGLTAPLAALSGAETAGGFAVPFDAIYRRIVDVLRDGKEVEYGFLGVSMTIPLAGDPAPAGVVLAGVTPGTPADRAGLVGGVGEAIVAVDGVPVREPDDLFLRLGAALAGTRVRVTVRRPGVAARDVDVTLAKYRHPLPWLASVRPPAVFGLRVDHSSVLVDPGRIAREDGLPTGVVVREVDPETPAARVAVLKDGVNRALVTHVDGKPIETPAEFYRLARGRAAVRLRVVPADGPVREQEVALP